MQIYNFSPTFLCDPFKIKRISKRIALVFLLLFVLGSIGYGVKQHFFSNKECLVWVKDHYEAIDYNEVINSVEVIPFNRSLLDDFKKLSVCDTTNFFKNGDYKKPIVWYGKAVNSKEFDFFNRPGLHPETGKTLKPISKYIIEKHILKD